MVQGRACPDFDDWVGKCRYCKIVQIEVDRKDLLVGFGLYGHGRHVTVRDADEKVFSGWIPGNWEGRLSPTESVGA